MIEIARMIWRIQAGGRFMQVHAAGIGSIGASKKRNFPILSIGPSGLS